ncbi:CDP-glucose 4,6-dehydratase [Microbacterium sp.]|uniref:CDP-glucose 4,6-dehydratase n=1 Tax=Microbacterium sp. TaxID=51671 RepID=UPI0027343911|nr:CDP-glucose 4,6-dehydratase [Microbacterium sp.]MDP3949878.1 CDP-glucose 4,6-dehydratase [Microbacterium sp.]
MTGNQVWRGKRVLLTGHTGFKGTWLTRMLIRLGAEVHGFALDPEPNSMFTRSTFAEHLASDVRADVADEAAVLDAVTRAQPEVVIHLAAQPLVREGYRSPAETMRTNILGTVNVLESVRATPSVRALLVITTDKVYRNEERLRGYREDDPLGGHDPYSASKAAADIVTDSYRLSFARDGLSVAAARAGNVLGGGDNASDRLVPDLIESFADGRPAGIRNPDAVRPWQHVLDPLTGYVELTQLLLAGGGQGSWNFGPPEEDHATVAAVADALVRHWGSGASWIQQQGENPHETGLLTLDASKARDQLGWRPMLNLHDALSWTVDWWREVNGGSDACDVTDRQIEQHVRLAKTRRLGG